jgi:hypothetical protein
MKQLRILRKKEIIVPSGNWSKAKDYFPEISIDQNTGTIRVTTFESEGHQQKGSLALLWISTQTEGNAAFVRGEVHYLNYKHYELSGPQKFCFAIFEDDSGHIYIYRAPATSRWMAEKPENIHKRLRKLGIGIEEPAIQQGDFLLKKVDRNRPTQEEFKHETMGAGHHKFVAPVLYCDKDGKRFYWVQEPVLLVHQAVDGIQHPDVIVEPGVYVVGMTATSLQHENLRD